MGKVSYGRTVIVGDWKIRDVKTRDDKRDPKRGKIDARDVIVFDTGKSMPLGKFLATMRQSNLLKPKSRRLGSAYRYSSRRSMREFRARFKKAFNIKPKRVSRYSKLPRLKSLAEAFRTKRIRRWRQPVSFLLEGRGRKAFSIMAYGVRRADAHAYALAKKKFPLSKYSYIQGRKGFVYFYDKMNLRRKLRSKGAGQSQTTAAIRDTESKMARHEP